MQHRVKIAAGAYGVVYRASKIDKDGNRTYFAVKRLLVSRGTSFCSSIREIDLVMTCQHPYVVKCSGLEPLDTVFKSGRPKSKSKRYKDDESVQVYEFYSAVLQPSFFGQPTALGSGAAEIRQPSSFGAGVGAAGASNEWKTILLKLLVGLEFIHGQGIVHRDLKPSNIMIDSRGRPRIGDFGQAQRVELVASNVWQTLRYRSPELLSRQTPADLGYDPRATDIWALGCIAYELSHDGNSIFSVLNNPEPFTEQALLEDIMKTDISTLPVLLARMLGINPQTRAKASDLVNDSFFADVNIGNVIQDVRKSCPPFSDKLDNLVLREGRMEYGKLVRTIHNTGTSIDLIPCLFHSLEIIDRLLSIPLTHNPRVIFLSVMYIMHKYLSEDHVVEVLEFDVFRKIVGITVEEKVDWQQMERDILRMVGYIVYRTTPYEYIVKKNKPRTLFGKVLCAYTRLSPGTYHVADIVAVTEQL